MDAKKIRGMEIHNSLERIKTLDFKAKNGGVSEPESREHQELASQFAILSLEDLKEYHDFMISIVEEGHVKKERLIERIKTIGTPNVQQVLQKVIEDVYKR